MNHSMVIFDCDGVLVDSEYLHNRVEAEYLGRCGLSMSPEECLSLFKGKTFQEVVGYIEQRFRKTLNHSWAYDLGMMTADRFMRELKPVDGVLDVVRRLHAEGRLMCVASQGSIEKMNLTLRLTGLLGYFDGSLFSSRHVARPKPYPDLFLHAAATMKQQPETCVVIEDSVTGVLAGVAAGMKVFGYVADGNRRELADAGAHVFTDMRELPELL